MTGCLNLDIKERPCDEKGGCLEGYYCDTARNVCVQAPSDASYPSDGSYDGAAGDGGGSLAPAITGLNGTGPKKDINPRTEDLAFWTAHSSDRKPVENRIASVGATIRVDGENLIYVSKAELIGQSGQGTFEMTIDDASMKMIKLGWPSTLIQTGLFTLKLTSPNGISEAQVYLMRGEQGEKGPQGDAGVKGDQGDKGDAGVQGEKGDGGPEGLKGDKGATVTAVVINPGGICSSRAGVAFTLSGVTSNICDGEKGDAGIQGIQGDKGDAGEKGDAGPQGDKGDAGPQGPQGDKGDAGSSAFTCDGSTNCTSSYPTFAISDLTVTDTYKLPDCPEGYSKDVRTDITLCTSTTDPGKSDNMVKVGDFWIDRYEAIVVDSAFWSNGTCDGTGTQYGDTDDWSTVPTFPYTGNWSTRLYACSKSSVKPSAYMTWFQAQEACSASGKRLCTSEEWQAAAAGTFDPGDNPGGSGSPTANTKCVTGASGVRFTGMAGSTPGGTDSCISKWGAEDMVGNLWEMVAMWGQGGPDNGVAAGAYAGKVGSVNGWDGFSPETGGGVEGDGTWNLAGAAYGCGRSGGNCGWKTGLPFSAIRGGSYINGLNAGTFSIVLYDAPTNSEVTRGFRCCRGR
jgi:hypothetical protein